MACEMQELETETKPAEVTILSRDAILTVDDSTMELVRVPEWGGAVYVRGIGSVARDKYEADCVVGRGKHRRANLKNMRARLVVLAACNDAGEPIFTHSDVEALGEKSAAAVDRLFDVAQRLGGFSEEDIEELAKNLETPPGDAIPSD